MIDSSDISCLNWYDRNAVSDSAISPPPTVILPDFLYLSSAATAANLPHLLTAGITHIINLSACSNYWAHQGDLNAEWERLRTSDRRLYATFVKRYGKNDSDIPFGYSAPKYYTIDIEDTEESDIRPFFWQCIRYIREIHRQNPDSRVLIHCYQGRSRSASIVIAYVMWAAQTGYDEALKLVRDRRPCVAPNQGFVKQLRAFEMELRQKRAEEEEQGSEVTARKSVESARRVSIVVVS